MAFDGTLKFDTEIDESGFKGGLKDVEKTSKKSAEEYKKDVMKLAQTYKKQGMNMSDAMKRAYSEIDKSQYDTAKESEKDSHKFINNWEGAADKLKAAGGIAVKALGAALAATGTAMIAFGKQSVETGMQFDSSMSQVAATMGTTVDQIQDLRDFAQKMGAETAFSATQAAEGLNILAMAGYDANKQIEVLPDVLSMAAAGGLDLAQSADYITGVLAGFSHETELTSKEIADTLATISASAKGSVQSFGEGLSTVAGMATTTGQKMKDMTVALGILGNNNVSAAEAGNALSRTLKNLYQPTSAAEKAMTALGISAYDTATGKARPLQDVLIDINNSMDGMTEKQKNVVLSQIFDSATLKTVPALLDNATDSWDKLAEAIDNSKDAAQNMANTQLDNLAGDVTLFQSALEGVENAIADVLKPTLRDFVQFGSQGLSELTGALKSGDFAAVVDTFEGILTDGLNMLITKLPQFMSVGTDILLALVSGIISVIPTLGTAAFEIINNLAGSIGEALPALIPAAVEAIVQFALALTDPNNLSALIDGAIALIIGVAEGLIEALPILIDNAPVIIENLATALIDNTPKLLDAALELILALAEGLITNLPALLAAAWKILTSLLTALYEFRETVKGWFHDLRVKAIATVLAFGVTMLQKATTAAKNVAKGIVSCFDNMPEKLAGIGGNLVKGLWNGIKEMKDWVIGKVKGFGKSVLNGIKAALGIASPSRFTKEFGRFLALGIDVGFAENMPDVGKTASQMLAAIRLPRPKVGFDYEGIRVDSGAVAAVNAYTAAFRHNMPPIIQPSPTADVAGSIANHYANTNNTYHQTLTFNQPIQTPSQVARAVRKALEVK